MATFRANTAGNWTLNIWDIYDEQTDTWSATSSYPNSTDDDVYLNGYNVTVNTSLTINHLSNYATDGVASGGAIYYTGSRILTANKIEMDMGGDNAFTFQQNTPTINCYINCPEIKISNACCFIHTYGVNRGWEINGNLYIDNCSLVRGGGAGTSRHLLTINGNVIGTNNNYFVGSFGANANAGWTITVNGNATKINDDNLNNLGKTIIYIAGTYRNNDNQELLFYQSTSTLTVGSIEYWSNNNTYGVKYISLVTPINPDTFYWRDITEPQRINPIIILANGELNDTNQYPTESNVRNNVEYAFGLMRGSMFTDYPQEAEVLSGVEYGRHHSGRNDIVFYDGYNYIYVKINNEYHWEIEHSTVDDITATLDTSTLTGYLGETSTDILNNRNTNTIEIGGVSITANTNQYTKYYYRVYKWNGTRWNEADQKNVPTISVDGGSVTAVDGYVVKYTGNNKYYIWNSTNIEWQEQTMNYLGETSTDIVNNPQQDYITLPYSISENSYIGTLEMPTTNVIIDAINQSTIGTNVGNISTAITTIDGKVDIIDTNVDTLLSRLTSVLTQRLGQSVTVEILQQILVAHLDN